MTIMANNRVVAHSLKLSGGIAVAALLLTGCATNGATDSPSSSESGERSAAGTTTCPDLLGPKDAPGYADVSTKYSVPISFVNESSIPLTLNASEIDCYDFSGAQNPSVFDGTKVAVGATGGPYTLIARRTCAYIPGDIIGKFQEREARWKTTVSSTTEPAVAGSIATTITCSSFGQNPTMCDSGASQDRAAYTVKLSNGSALRADYRCEDQSSTITFSDLY